MNGLPAQAVQQPAGADGASFRKIADFSSNHEPPPLFEVEFERTTAVRLPSFRVLIAWVTVRKFTSVTTIGIMVWVSRLTLIAYLVGGWLLPATHYHVDHDHGVCQHARHHVAVGKFGADCERPDGDHSCHGRGHTEHCETSSDDDPQPSIPVNYWTATQGSGCSGLCALCLARSLASFTLRHVPTEFACCESPQSVRHSETLLPCSASSANCSRGPPTIV